MAGEVFRHIDEGVFGEEGDAAEAAIGEACFAVHHADDVFWHKALGFSEGEEEARHAGLAGDGSAVEIALGAGSAILAVVGAGWACFAGGWEFVFAAGRAFGFAIFLDGGAFASAGFAEEGDEGAGDVGGGVALL